MRMRWHLVAVVAAACGDDLSGEVPLASLKPLPTLWSGPDDAVAVGYRTDETGELWSIVWRQAGDFLTSELHRFDRGAAAWSRVDTGDLIPFALGTSSDGKLLIYRHRNTLDPDVPSAPQWTYVAPGATELGEPIAADVDIDGDGMSDLDDSAAMDGAGRLYATIATRTRWAVVRIEPGAPSVAEVVLELPRTSQYFAPRATPIPAPNGAVYIVHDDGAAIDRFAPDGSGPTRVLDASDGCPPMFSGHWQWFAPDVGYFLPGYGIIEAAQAYRLTSDGKCSLFSDTVAESSHYIDGLSYLDDGRVLGFLRYSDSPYNDPYVRDASGDPARPWSQLARFEGIFRPVPGLAGRHHWVMQFDNGPLPQAYELFLDER
jgi:hypothetical protein